MYIESKQSKKLNIALMGAKLLGIEYGTDKNYVACSFDCVTINSDLSLPKDRRHLLIFYPFIRFTGTLKIKNNFSKVATIVKFEPTAILEILAEFPSSSQYSNSINGGNAQFDQLHGDYSFDDNTELSSAATNTVDMKLKSEEKEIYIRIWFDEIDILNSDYERKDLVTFIDNGERAWDSIIRGDLNSINEFGIIPISEENAKILASRIELMKKNEP